MSTYSRLTLGKPHLSFFGATLHAKDILSSQIYSCFYALLLFKVVASKSMRLNVESNCHCQLRINDLPSLD